MPGTFPEHTHEAATFPAEPRGTVNKLMVTEQSLGGYKGFSRILSRSEERDHANVSHHRSICHSILILSRQHRVEVDIVEISGENSRRQQLSTPRAFRRDMRKVELVFICPDRYRLCIPTPGHLKLLTVL
jgi:hypothetical protein